MMNITANCASRLLRVVLPPPQAASLIKNLICLLYFAKANNAKLRGIHSKQKEQVLIGWV